MDLPWDSWYSRPSWSTSRSDARHSELMGSSDYAVHSLDTFSSLQSDDSARSVVEATDKQEDVFLQLFKEAQRVNTKLGKETPGRNKFDMDIIVNNGKVHWKYGHGDATEEVSVANEDLQTAFSDITVQTRPNLSPIGQALGLTATISYHKSRSFDRNGQTPQWVPFAERTPGWDYERHVIDSLSIVFNKAEVSS